MIYPYVKDNNLYDRQYYNYARYDDEFFASYRQNRRDALSRHDAVAKPNDEQIIALLGSVGSADPDSHDNAGVCLREAMRRLTLGGYDGGLSEESLEMAARIVKTFEVRKRLYHYYNEKMRPLDEDDFEDRSLYVLFAGMTAVLYKRTSDLKYLNALLKVNDILLSLEEDIFKDDVLGKLFVYSLSEELADVDMLMRVTNR